MDRILENSALPAEAPWERAMRLGIIRPVAGGEQPPAAPGAQATQQAILQPGSAAPEGTRAQTPPGAGGVPAPAPAGGPPAPAAAPAPPGEPPIRTLEELAARYPTLADKFPDLSRMADSYLGLERLFTRYRQAGIDPEEALDALIESQQTGGGEPSGREAPSDDLSDDEFMALLAENPREAIRQVIARETMPDREARAYDTARSMWADARGRFSDIATYEAAMVDLLQQMPMIVNLPDAVDRLYHLAKYGTPEATQQAITQAQAAERANVLQGVRTGTVIGGTGGGTPPARATTEAERITAEILGAAPPRPVLRPL